MLVEVRCDGFEVVLPYEPQNRERQKGGVLLQEGLLDQIRYY
jgi:hypothetical protein